MELRIGFVPTRALWCGEDPIHTTRFELYRGGVNATFVDALWNCNLAQGPGGQSLSLQILSMCAHAFLGLQKSRTLLRIWQRKCDITFVVFFVTGAQVVACRAIYTQNHRMCWCPWWSKDADVSNVLHAWSGSVLQAFQVCLNRVVWNLH